MNFWADERRTKMKFWGGTLGRVEIWVRCCMICEIAQFLGDGRRFAPKVT